MLITHQGHRIEFLPDHAIHLPDHDTLVLSDPHFGKAATFQALGLPVPQGDDERDLQRIDRLLASTGARNLIIAGDLLHSPRGQSPALLHWLAHCPVKVTLVIGNHDRQLPDLPIPCLPSLQLGTLHIVHDPAHAPHDLFSICGHLHPVVRLKDTRRSTLRLPCFHLTTHQLILPAFGSFTGGHPIKPTPPDQIFLPLNNTIINATPLC